MRRQHPILTWWAWGVAALIAVAVIAALTQPPVALPALPAHCDKAGPCQGVELLAKQNQNATATLNRGQEIRSGRGVQWEAKLRGYTPFNLYSYASVPTRKTMSIASLQWVQTNPSAGTWLASLQEKNLTDATRNNLVVGPYCDLVYGSQSRDPNVLTLCAKILNHQNADVAKLQPASWWWQALVPKFALWYTQLYGGGAEALIYVIVILGLLATALVVAAGALLLLNLATLLKSQTLRKWLGMTAGAAGISLVGLLLSNLLLTLFNWFSVWLPAWHWMSYVGPGKWIISLVAMAGIGGLILGPLCWLTFSLPSLIRRSSYLFAGED